MSFINMSTSLIPKKERKGVFATEEFLAEKSGIAEDISNIFNVSSISKPLENVLFDTENLTCTEVFGSPLDEEGNLVGYHTIGETFSFIGCMAGGDWENPLFFIVYYDGKVMRGYIPVYGNTYNLDTKTAFGSEEDAPGFDATVLYPDKTPEELEALFNGFNGPSEAYCEKFGVKFDDIQINWNAIVTDIKAKFDLVGALDS